MKRVFFISLLFLVGVHAKGQTFGFEKTYDVFLYDKITSVQQTADGGYMVSGWGGDMTISDIYLIKTDGNGGMLWVETYGGFWSEQIGSAQQTTDGGYIITGSKDVGGTNVELWLIKTDSNGNTEWDTVYSAGPFFDYGMSVKQCGDQGYIITGIRTINGTDTDVWLIKTDSIGTIEWDSLYGGTGNDEPVAVEQTTDNGFIIAGKTNSYGAGLDDYYLIKTDSTGNTQWTKTYGGTGNDDAWDIEQTSDGGYIVAGRRQGLPQGYIIKTDANGDSLWTTTTYLLAPQIIQTPDGGYAAISTIDNGGPTNVDMYLIRMDGNGDTLWTSSYSKDSFAAGGETGFAISLCSDGGFIMAGETGTAGTDVYLVKTDSLGAVIVSGLIEHSQTDFKLHPNPTSSGFATITNGEQGITNIEVFDLFGRSVPFEFDIGSSLLDIQNSPPGIYFVRILSGAEGGEAVRKLILH